MYRGLTSLPTYNAEPLKIASYIWCRELAYFPTARFEDTISHGGCHAPLIPRACHRVEHCLYQLPLVILTW